MYSESCHSSYAFFQNKYHYAITMGRTAANLILAWDIISYSHLKLNSVAPIITVGPMFVLYSQPSVLFFF